MWLCGYVAMWLCGYVAIKISNLQILKFQKSQSQVHRTFENFENFEVSDFPNPYFPRMVLICFLIFQVILSNKMKKYGLPGPKTSIIHEMLSFRCLMQLKSGFYKLGMKEKNPIKTLKPLFNEYDAIFCPKIAIMINPIFPMIFL